MSNKTFVVIKTGGKQYIAEQGAILNIEKLAQKEGSDVRFEDVLLYANEDTVEVGTPTILDVFVRGKVIKDGRADKVTTFKFRRRKRYAKTKGHRQPYTQVEITSIVKGQDAASDKLSKSKPIAKSSKVVRRTKPTAVRASITK